MERQLGVRPSAVVVAVMVFLLILSIISNASGLVVGVGCFVVPAYLTLGVLGGDDWEPLVKYVYYWVSWGVLEVIGGLLVTVLPSMLYILLRVGFAVAMLHPESPLSNLLCQQLHKVLD